MKQNTTKQSFIATPTRYKRYYNINMFSRLANLAHTAIYKVACKPFRYVMKPLEDPDLCIVPGCIGLGVAAFIGFIVVQFAEIANTDYDDYNNVISDSKLTGYKFALKQVENKMIKPLFGAAAGALIFGFWRITFPAYCLLCTYNKYKYNTFSAIMEPNIKE